MNTRTSQPAGGALLLSEIKEFAAFTKATQRYIRRSLDVAYGRRDAIDCWARDEAEVASIRASFEYGKYAEVLERAGARIDRGDLRDEELAELHRLAGLSAFNLNRLDDASRHFKALLRLEPDHSLDPFVVPPPAYDPEGITRGLEQLGKLITQAR